MEQLDERVVRSRRRICDAVIDLVVDHGLAAVTIDAVVARSGVARTTLYRHWPSRDELVCDAIAGALPEPVCTDTGSLAGDLRALARGLAAGLSDPRYSAILGAVALPGTGDGLDEVRAIATAARHRALCDVVERARRRGEPIPVDGVDGLIRSIAGPLFYRRFVEGAPVSRVLADRCVQRALAPLHEALFDRAARSNLRTASGVR